MAQRGQNSGLLLGQSVLALLVFGSTIYLHFMLFHLDGPAAYPQQPIELWQRGAFILASVGFLVLLLSALVKGQARRILLAVGIGATLGGLAGFALIPLYLG